jgi:hypothetical protein
VLPEAEDRPALPAQRPGDEPIPGLIAGQLFQPKLRVVPRLRRMLRAAVPEAAVNEDGEFQFGEKEIGFAGEPA